MRVSTPRHTTSIKMAGKADFARSFAFENIYECGRLHTEEAAPPPLNSPFRSKLKMARAWLDILHGTIFVHNSGWNEDSPFKTSKRTQGGNYLSLSM
ncbi:hypothetical protein CEXT_74581 [Caerostris extrusa]|uniref:Uncharacterized protein n=1 Tax=Caerostris extrusa TaxID=172846 RepID=A0AAV4T9N6_CAEEX|nr:hypothetical protein CEXT_74581 [Caerostris extrusa]